MTITARPIRNAIVIWPDGTDLEELRGHRCIQVAGHHNTIAVPKNQGTCRIVIQVSMMGWLPTLSAFIGTIIIIIMAIEVIVVTGPVQFT